MPGNYIKHANGIYKLKITNMDIGEAKTGTPYVSIQADIVRCVKTSDSKPYTPAAGSRTEVKLYLSEKTRDKAVAFLRAAGFEEGRSFNDLKMSSPNHFTGSGFEFDASCKNEKYTNKDGVEDNFAKFEAFPIKSASIKTPLSSQKIAHLDALFGGGKKKTVAAPATTEVGSAVDNSDLPW